MKPESYSLIDTALKNALWPSVFILIIFLFRKQIKDFINKLISAKNVKLGTDGFSFESQTEKAVASSEINDENGKLDPPPDTKEKEVENTYWYLSVTDLLRENKIPEAKAEFETFVRGNKESINYDNEFAFFYLFYFNQQKMKTF